MKDPQFWRIVALLSVAGLFYVGHGLHDRAIDFPSIESQALAGGVAVQEGSLAVTCSEDGKTVYYFGPRRSASNFNTAAFRFLGAVNAEKQ